MIQDIRRLSGLSRAAFSRKYGIPYRTIEDWEKGKSKPPEYVIHLLSRVVLEDYFPAYYCNNGDKVELYSLTREYLGTTGDAPQQLGRGEIIDGVMYPIRVEM